MAIQVDKVVWCKERELKNNIKRNEPYGYHYIGTLDYSMFHSEIKDYLEDENLDVGDCFYVLVRFEDRKEKNGVILIYAPN